MAVNEPTLSNAVDKEAVAGDAVTLTLTPPTAGDYDHCQILYRKITPTETAWTTGPTVVGVQGTQTTQNVDSLGTGDMYEFQVYAVDGAGNAGPPSIPRRAIPTTGSGPISLRIENDIKTALEAITQANGHYDTIQDCWIYRFPKDMEGQDGLWIALRCATVRYTDGPLIGADAIINGALIAHVLACHHGRDTSDAAWIREKAHKLIAAVQMAILSDQTRSGLAISTKHGDAILTPDDDVRKVADAVAYTDFTINYRHKEQNPYSQNY